MIPGVGYVHQAMCNVRGPDPETPGHTHECIGQSHGYDEHLCACGEWFKVAAVEVRVARVPDSAREEAS